MEDYKHKIKILNKKCDYICMINTEMYLANEIWHDYRCVYKACYELLC